MSFLDDKKNQPIIIGVAIAVILAVGVFMYLQMRPAQPQVVAETPDMSAPPPQAPGGSKTPPPPAGSTAPPATPAPPAGAMTPGPRPAPGRGPAAAAKPTAASPAEKFRPDPFASLNPPKAKRIAMAPPREPIPYPTWLIIPRKTPIARGDNKEADVIDTTPRRMAGVLFGGAVSAILETGSETVVVRPGDLVENSTMRVEKIEPNRIILKSLGPGRARYVEVNMAAGLGNPVVAAPTVTPTPTAPTAPRPGSGPPPPARGVYGRPS
jgi:hypothetical protein